jgi:hypothetical protein
MGRIPDSGTLPVDVGAWLDELVALGRKNDAGHTTAELAAAAGCSGRTMLGRLKQAQQMGRLVAGSRTVIRIDGMPTQIPVYRVTAPPKAKRK